MSSISGYVAAQTKVRAGSTTARTALKKDGRKWVRGITMVAVVFVLLGAWKEYRLEEATKPPRAAATQPRVETKPAAVKEVVQFGPGCSEPRKTHSNQCIRWDEKSPGKNTFTSFVVPQNGDDWVPWKEYRKRYAGTGGAVDFKHVKHCAEAETEVHYTVRPREGAYDTCY